MGIILRNKGLNLGAGITERKVGLHGWFRRSISYNETWAEAVCVKRFFSYLPYVGGFLRVLRFPPPEKLTLSSSFHRLDMTLAVAEALNPSKPKNLIKRFFKPSVNMSVCLCWISILLTFLLYK